MNVRTLQAARWFLSLSVAGVGVGGCAQAAIDADAGLFDMMGDDEDGGALDGSLDAALTEDAAQWPDSAAEDAGVDAAVDAAAGRDAAADAAVEASVDAASPCVPGTYKGKFEGKISVKFIGLELLALDITGDVNIHVATNSTGDKLVLDQGKIEGTDQDDNPIVADVTGTLNCTTNKLEGGKLENGKYTRGILGTVNFTGTTTANYTRNPPSAEGTWKTNGGVEMGMGTWNAALVE